MEQPTIPMSGQVKQVFDLIDMTNENPCLESTSQHSDMGSTDLRVQASIASNQLDCLSPCQESSVDHGRPCQEASFVSYGNPGECLFPCQHYSKQSASDLCNRSGFSGLSEGDLFPKYGSVPVTPATSVFDDDFVAASPVAGSPVWSHHSGIVDDTSRTSTAVMSASSMSTHKTLSTVPMDIFTVPPPSGILAGAVGYNTLHTESAVAPIACLSEFNHVGDSPSPAISKTTSGTSNQSNSSEQKRRACVVSLQRLFDVEAAASGVAQQQIGDSVSINSDNVCAGFHNPVANISEWETKFDLIDGNCESRSLMSYDSSPWRPGYRQDGDAYPSPSATSFNTVISDTPMCRICHEGELTSESLISPCRCTGTLQYLHRKCLEQWLQTKNKDVCELCNFEFHTQRKTQPLSEWFRHPSTPRDRRNLGVDLVCGLILTPMVVVSAWLCLNGSSHYLHYHERSLEGMGLILLALVLLLIFSSWSLLTIRYHFMVWREWSQHNQLVTVLTQTTPTTPQPSTSTPQHCSSTTQRTSERRETIITTSVSVSNNSSQVEAASV